MRNESDIDTLLNISRSIQKEAFEVYKPPDDGGIPSSQLIIPFSIVKGSRGYIEKIVNQINGTYENGYFDACAVMIRRLLETLIIEMFEHHKIDSKIKNREGNFFFLRDLIDITLKEQKWNLGRNTKTNLRKLKDIGDKSAHSRRYIAHRNDIEKHIVAIRDVVQEFLYIANLK